MKAAVSLKQLYIHCLIIRIGFSTAITPLVAEADAENDVSKFEPRFITVCFYVRF
jgi:hypothetical protein